MFRNQKVGFRTTPLTVTTKDPQAKYLPPIPVILGTDGMSPTGKHSNISVELEIKTATDFFEICMPLDQQAKIHGYGIG